MRLFLGFVFEDVNFDRCLDLALIIKAYCGPRLLQTLLFFRCWLFTLFFLLKCKVIHSLPEMTHYDYSLPVITPLNQRNRDVSYLSSSLEKLQFRNVLLLTISSMVITLWKEYHPHKATFFFFLVYQPIVRAECQDSEFLFFFHHQIVANLPS